MLFLFLFSLVYCQNIIKNPSFEQVDSNNKLLNWIVHEKASLSSDCHSGNKSLHWKQTNQTVFNYQIINVEKNYIYEVCAYIKFINAGGAGSGFQMYIRSNDRTPGIYEIFESKVLSGNFNWDQTCFTTWIIKKSNNVSIYLLGIFSLAKNGSDDSDREIFIDDISVKKINFRIAINNDRDEVYDTINIVYQIIGKEDYNLTDFELITKIKDNKTTFYDKNIKISSLFFTYQIEIKNLNLKDNNFYQVEGILNNKKDNLTYILLIHLKK